MPYPKMLCARGKKLDTSLLVAYIAGIIHLINVRINIFSNPIGIPIGILFPCIYIGIFSPFSNLIGIPIGNFRKRWHSIAIAIICMDSLWEARTTLSSDYHIIPIDMGSIWHNQVWTTI